MFVLRPLARAASASASSGNASGRSAMSGLAQVVPDDARFHQRLPDVIEPKWWTGESPIPTSSFVIDATKFQVNIAKKTLKSKCFYNFFWQRVFFSLEEHN